MSYQDRLQAAGEAALQVDERLRMFGSREGLGVEVGDASLKVRGADRRAVVFQPRPAGRHPPGLRVQFHVVDDPDEIKVISEGLRKVGGRVEPTFSFVPLGVLAEHWDDVEQFVLSPFFNLANAPRAFRAGDRVRLRTDVERYPDAVANSGLVGTVVDTTDGIVVQLDDVVPGLEDWDNKLYATDESPLVEDLELVEGVQDLPPVG